jgi:hypothetical protein
MASHRRFSGEPEVIGLPQLASRQWDHRSRARKRRVQINEMLRKRVLSLLVVGASALCGSAVLPPAKLQRLEKDHATA